MENKKENFSEWYNEIVEISGLSDKRYPVKGMNVWLPYGMKIMREIDRIIRETVEVRGIEEVNFPVLITRDQLSVEFEHVKGFENQVYWVTKGGNDKLDVEMALRPTSEAAMYGMFALWIRSHTDLPLRIYQIVNVYRYETKHTRSFIRVREIHFFEAHTAHATFEESENQLLDYLEIWKKVSSELCIPYIVNKRPEWDKFPGAMYTLAGDTLVGGRSLQVATMHEYGTNFSKNYNITYLKDDGTHDYVNQTTFGMSERLLAAVIGIHGDDKGLILPPSIASVQVIIIIIPSENPEVKVYAHKVERMLREIGIRASIDDRDNYTPGFKYNEWEMKGVPLRIEIGEKEFIKNTVTFALRPTREKRTVPVEKISETLTILDEIKTILTNRAEEYMKNSIHELNDINEIAEVNGFLKVGWCGRKECSDKLEEKFGLGNLGIPYESNEKKKCIVCSKPGSIAVFSHSF